MSCIVGKHAITEALLAETPIERIFVQHNKKTQGDICRIIALSKQDKIPVKFISSSECDRYAGNTQHQGIVAILSPQKNSSLDQVLDHPNRFPLILIVDHIQDPYNFGAILRSSEVLGVSAVLYPKDRNASFSPGVSKAASGATAYLPTIKITNIAQTIDLLQKAGYWIYGADSNAGEALPDCKANFPLALVVGNENKGLSKNIIKRLDQALHIPQRGKTESLNVSVATGIILNHLAQQLPD